MRGCCLISLAALVAAVPARAAPAVKLSPGSGHPGVTVAVSGSGFGDSEAVDLYVGTVDTTLLVTSATGTFSGSVTVPSSAQPGADYITAIGRRSGNTAQGPYRVTTMWPQIGFGASHGNWNPYENTLNASNVNTLRTLWQFPVLGIGATPVIYDGDVYVSTATGIQARSTGTGKLIWNVLTSDGFYGTPTVFQGVVYIATDDSPTLYALKASSGAKIWGKTLSDISYSSAAIANGVVYIGTFDGKITAFNAANGAKLWVYTTKGEIDGSPTVVDGVVYIGSADNSMYALNATTGALIWSYATGGAIETTPAVVDGVVYFGSDDDYMYAMQANGTSAGALLWRAQTNGAIYGSPAVAYGTVYFGSSDDIIYALNAHSGVTNWTYETAGVLRTPAVANGVVYVTSGDNLLYALNASSGALLTTEVTGASHFGGPAVSDGVLYVDADGSDIYAFALDAGTNVRRAAGPKPALSSLQPNLSLRISR